MTEEEEDDEDCCYFAPLSAWTYLHKITSFVDHVVSTKASCAYKCSFASSKMHNKITRFLVTWARLLQRICVVIIGLFLQSEHAITYFTFLHVTV